MSQVKITIKDYSNEDSQINWPLADTAGVTEVASLQAAIDGMVVGTIGETIFVDETVVDAGSVAIPANAFAQRENRYVIEYIDTVNMKTYFRSIPSADLSLLSSGTEQLDLNNVTVQTFVTAF